MEGESLDQMTARHRRELKDLQGRITSKKKNATKKTRKGVNDECSGMERQLREKQAAEVASLDSTPRDVEPEPDADADADDDTNTNDEANGPERAAAEADDEAIDAAVDKLRLNGDALPAPSAAAGKKRNRQKERLARRAAEQEAAAQQASEEASGMTDHRARESEYMRRTIAAHGLVEKDIEPDGHCLFSAVADQLAQSGIPTGRTDASEPALPRGRRPGEPSREGARHGRVGGPAGAHGAGEAVRRRDTGRAGREDGEDRGGGGRADGQGAVAGVLSPRVWAGRALQFSEEEVKRRVGLRLLLVTSWILGQSMFGFVFLGGGI
ncbi:OTU domain-containing protein 6B [Metarhizium guizhouense ARSEF 977]|uniref:OTU domain-containing protein 6B n=1 Tax=Metarhizium guizhouense (strain ARSEF 977) TaxID=1276136 RepID=A0A0B4HD52_METGA|nr:OTU domain-containing protein 6B [Metarhizium guizhouense ARSEF 977]